MGKLMNYNYTKSPFWIGKLTETMAMGHGLQVRKVQQSFSPTRWINFSDFSHLTSLESAPRHWRMSFWPWNPFGFEGLQRNGRKTLLKKCTKSVGHWVLMVDPCWTQSQQKFWFKKVVLPFLQRNLSWNCFWMGFHVRCKDIWLCLKGETSSRHLHRLGLKKKNSDGARWSSPKNMWVPQVTFNTQRLIHDLDDLGIAQWLQKGLFSHKVTSMVCSRNGTPPCC